MGHTQQHESINDLVRNAYAAAKRKGFHSTENDENLPTKLCLIHSEISEALEELRKNPDPFYIYKRASDGKPEGFVFELADAMIRIFDLIGTINHIASPKPGELRPCVDFAEVIEAKMRFNETRPALHGKGF